MTIDTDKLLAELDNEDRIKLPVDAYGVPLRQER
jgi:hypothetical protein